MVKLVGADPRVIGTVATLDKLEAQFAKQRDSDIRPSGGDLEGSMRSTNSTTHT
jgi:hypothetical protein